MLVFMGLARDAWLKRKQAITNAASSPATNDYTLSSWFAGGTRIVVPQVSRLDIHVSLYGFTEYINDLDLSVGSSKFWQEF